MNIDSNEHVLKIVTEQYQEFINKTNGWDFFHGLAEYVKTIEESMPTRQIVEAFRQQQEYADRMREELKRPAFLELEAAARKMSAFAEEYNRVNEPLLRQVRESEEMIKGMILTAKPLYFLNDSVFHTALMLKNLGNEEAIKSFIPPNINNVVVHEEVPVFSPSFEKLRKVDAKIERREQVEPWGAWQNLPVVKRLVFEPDELISEVSEEIEDDPEMKMRLLSLVGIYNELESLRTGKKSDNDVVFLKVGEFRRMVERVQSHITVQLQIGGPSSPSLNFDVNCSVLQFAGKSIVISKRNKGDAHDLLKTLFRDPTKQWNTDEILDDWHFSHDKKMVPKNKTYQAGKAVNRIVCAQTLRDDFLITNTKYVQVNPKYLSR